MRFRLLERVQDGQLEQVKIFDTFVSHTVEANDRRSETQMNFESESFSMTKEECVAMYKQAGFEEVVCQ
jgi:hypothetical protein